VHEYSCGSCLVRIVLAQQPVKSLWAYRNAALVVINLSLLCSIHTIPTATQLMLMLEMQGAFRKRFLGDIAIVLEQLQGLRINAVRR
jgi:hypothetical protein